MSEAEQGGAPLKVASLVWIGSVVSGGESSARPIVQCRDPLLRLLPEKIQFLLYDVEYRLWLFPSTFSDFLQRAGLNIGVSYGNRQLLLSQPLGQEAWTQFPG